jgi:uncharacterized membrane protein
MIARPSRIANLHRFFADQLVYPVVLSSLLGVTFYIVRWWWSGSPMHIFLMWNLFLAWIPYLSALLMAKMFKHNASPWLYVFPFIVWLLFFPNSLYLVTDLQNLTDLPPVPFWYDLGFFATMAWTGVLLAVASLQILQRIVRHSLGWVTSWLFVLFVIGLNGVGIYLGRFLRWNSWDVVTEPRAVLQDAIMPFLHPIAYRQPVAIIIVFSALLLVCYVSVLALQHHESPQ